MWWFPLLVPSHTYLSILAYAVLESGLTVNLQLVNECAHATGMGGHFTGRTAQTRSRFLCKRESSR